MHYAHRQYVSLWVQLNTFSSMKSWIEKRVCTSCWGGNTLA